MAPPEVIDAGVVVLRRWDPARVVELDRAIEASMPELLQYMPWATADHSIEQTREYVERSALEWAAGEAWNYALLTPADEVVGSIGLMTRMGPGVLEIGYWVHSAHTGRGIATAAVRALAAVGLTMPGIERVAVKHDRANPASGRVAEKAGFTRVAEHEREPEAPGEIGVDVVWELRR